MYFVYILLSRNNQKTYTGITDNLKRRLNQHNNGYHLYTKRYKPWSILYYEDCLNRDAARKREKYLKSAAGRKWIAKNFFS